MSNMSYGVLNVMVGCKGSMSNESDILTENILQT